MFSADDGEMGSFRIEEQVAAAFAGPMRCIADAEYLDDDGTLVVITLTEEPSGQISVDLWKVDFSPLESFPSHNRLFNIRPRRSSKEANKFAYPRTVAENPPKSVGLGGDGDEIAAIGDVERVFGVKLNYADAPGWSTAGDVFRSLQKALPTKELDSPDLWKRFAVALCGETGVNPSDIEPDSPLLSRSVWMHVANVSAVVWIGVGATAIALVLWALL